MIIKILGFGAVVFLTFSVDNAHANSRPRLFPNQHLSQVGETRANRDIDACMDQAAAHMHRNQRTGDGLRAGTRSAARGALLGTAGGAIMGNTGRGAATGATVGAGASVLRGITQSGSNDPAFQNFTNVCLEDKGYRVLDWQR